MAYNEEKKIGDKKGKGKKGKAAVNQQDDDDSRDSAGEVDYGVYQNQHQGLNAANSDEERV